MFVVCFIETLKMISVEAVLLLEVFFISFAELLELAGRDGLIGCLQFVEVVIYCGFCGLIFYYDLLDRIVYCSEALLQSGEIAHVV